MSLNLRKSYSPCAFHPRLLGINNCHNEEHVPNECKVVLTIGQFEEDFLRKALHLYTPRRRVLFFGVGVKNLSKFPIHLMKCVGQFKRSGKPKTAIPSIKDIGESEWETFYELSEPMQLSKFCLYEPWINEADNGTFNSFIFAKMVPSQIRFLVKVNDQPLKVTKINFVTMSLNTPNYMIPSLNKYIRLWNGHPPLNFWRHDDSDKKIEKDNFDDENFDE